jgi:hypothetical protein
LAWTGLLILALVLSPTVVAVGVAIDFHIAEPTDSAAPPISTGQPVLRDPIDTDGPGATFSGGFR